MLEVGWKTVVPFFDGFLQVQCVFWGEAGA